MDEVEYVVPPENYLPKTTTNNSPEKPPKEPNKSLEWVKSHRFLSVAIAIMSVIVLLVAITMITGQRVSIFGFQLNPLYNQASLLVPCNPMERICEGIPQLPTIPGEQLPLPSETTPPGLPVPTPTIPAPTPVPGETKPIPNETTPPTPTPAPGENTSRFTLTGTFPVGVVGQTYSTEIRTSGKQISNCSWSIDSIVPTVSGSTVINIVNVIQADYSAAMFSATPVAAGLYKVNLSARCGADGNAQNTFDWVVGKTATTGGGSITGVSNCHNQGSLGRLSAIYRYWSPSMSDHMYTTNPNEKPNGYRFEGVAGYVYAEQVPGTVPIHRSAQLQIGSHYYTTEDSDPTEYGYVDQGIIGYAFNSSVSGSSPWYRLHKGGEASDYVHTISESERIAIKELGYVDQGVVAYICGGSTAIELQPLFRLWGIGDTDHFYTTNFSERDALLTRNYVSEGITGYLYGVSKDGGVPMYRAYNSAIGDHLYTLSESEARTPGYVYEGVIGYVSANDTAQTTPLYRLYNSQIGDHFYTVNAAEAVSAIGSGYVGEGVTGYLYISQ